MTMFKMFAMTEFDHDISRWRPENLRDTVDVFLNSKLEKFNKVPFWALVGVEFLPQAIKAYHLQALMDEKLRPKTIEDKYRVITNKI